MFCVSLQIVVLLCCKMHLCCLLAAHDARVQFCLFSQNLYSMFLLFSANSEMYTKHQMMQNPANIYICHFLKKSIFFHSVCTVLEIYSVPICDTNSKQTYHVEFLAKLCLQRRQFSVKNLKSVSFSSDGSNTILLYIKRNRTSFFEHRTNSNMFIYLRSNSNT